MADGQATFKVVIEVDPSNLNKAYTDLGQGIKGATTGLDGEVDKVNKRLGDATRSSQQFQAQLSNTRYALYDVSSTLGGTGALLLGLATATTAVAIAWEKDFAQVARTSGATGDALQKLRSDLVDLTQTMPSSFGDLARIATLAGQLNVPAERIASFTETVAKTVAVTDLSVDAAATAFGRLDALLPDVQGNYEALGSSIALVGVNSVATESQIVNISTQISSMGNFAGLTAAEVVGLSGALASVGAAPEISRGTVTRVFTQMQKAISNGGDSLERFAKIAGVSGDEFASAFGTNRFGPIFQKFIEGLGDSARVGGDATKALADLGITSVRDVPLLLRLAEASDLVNQSFADGKAGFEAASELSKQYAVISETTAAKLQILVNNFMALLDALGSANLGPLGSVLDALSGFLGFLTDVAGNDFLSPFLGFATVMTGVAGALALAGAAMALFGASSIGIYQGLNGIIAIAPKASALILGTGTASAIASGEMKAGAASAALMGRALKGLGIIAAALVIPDLASGITKGAGDLNFALAGLEQGGGAALERVKNSMKELVGFFNAGDFAASLNRAFAPNSNQTLLRDLAEVDQALATLAKSGSVNEVTNRLTTMQREFVAAGGTASAFKIAFTDTYAAIDEAYGSSVEAQLGIDGLNGSMADAEQQAAATEAALKALKDAILSFGEVGINAEQASINLSRALNDMNDAAANSEAVIGGTNTASLTLRQSFIDVDKAARDAAIAMVDNGASADEATAQYLTQRQAIIDVIASRTGDRAAAEQWAETVFGSAAEAEAAVRNYNAEVNRTSTSKDTQFTNNAGPQLRSVDLYNNSIRSVPTSWHTTFTQTVQQTSLAPSSNYAPWLRSPQNRATGGPIYGPGTGTSDSVPIWASNGEFMMRTAAVQKYGLGFMNAINSGKIPKFANGGHVGGSGGGGGGFPMGGVMELGPRTVKALGNTIVNVGLDDVAISRSAERGNNIRRFNGEI